MAGRLSVFLRAGAVAVVVAGSAVSAPDGDAASQKLVSLLESMGGASPSVEEPVASPVPSADGPLRELLAKAQASFADAALAGESAVERDMGARLAAAASGAVSRGTAFVSGASPRVSLPVVDEEVVAVDASDSVAAARGMERKQAGALDAKVAADARAFNAALRAAKTRVDAIVARHFDGPEVATSFASVVAHDVDASDFQSLLEAACQELSGALAGTKANAIPVHGAAFLGKSVAKASATNGDAMGRLALEESLAESEHSVLQAAFLRRFNGFVRAALRQHAAASRL